MNTKLFLLPILGAALTAGCSGKRTIDSLSVEQSVRFRSLVARPERGIDVQALSGINFGLWAYQGPKGAATWDGFSVSSNAKILDGGQGGYANANQTVYWPSDGALLGFYAYAPYSTQGAYGVTNLTPSAVGVDVVNVPSFDFAVAPKVNDQVDLLVARSEGLSPTPSVPLTFRHALTKPTIMARVTAPNWRVAITEVVFSGVASQGRYTFPVWPADPNAIDGWQVDPATTTFYTPLLNYNGSADPLGPGRVDAVVFTTDSYAPVLSSEAGSSLFLLPQTLGKQAELVVRYNIYSISSNTSIVESERVPISLAGGVWSAGNQVTYRLSFDPKPAGQVGSLVQFSSSVTGWDGN